MTGSARTAGTLAQEGTLTMLYRAGAVAALTTVAITLFQIVAGIIWPPPDFAPTAAAATHILEMAQSAPVLTFVKLDGLMLFDYVLLAVVYVALYAALGRKQPSLMALGTVFALMAITLYFAVNPAATALVLAGQYSADGSANGVVTAMQAVLAGFQGTGFLVHYLVMGVAGILVGLAMLRSDVFSRGTAIAGILQGVMMLVPVTFGMVGLLFALGSLIPFVVWFVLVGRRLMQLAGEGAGA